jgi:hypothetical protein
MPYVSRNDAGVIIELHNSPPHPNSQWLELDHPEVSDFLQKIGLHEQAKRTLTLTDTEMVRVIEDLIDLLIAKQSFTFTELPKAVQDKLGTRKQLRKDINSLSNLIDTDEDIF